MLTGDGAARDGRKAGASFSGWRMHAARPGFSAPVFVSAHTRPREGMPGGLVTRGGCARFLEKGQVVMRERRAVTQALPASAGP